MAELIGTAGPLQPHIHPDALAAGVVRLEVPMLEGLNLTVEQMEEVLEEVAEGGASTQVPSKSVIPKKQQRFRLSRRAENGRPSTLAGGCAAAGPAQLRRRVLLPPFPTLLPPS